MTYNDIVYYIMLCTSIPMVIILILIIIMIMIILIIL